MPKWEIKYRGLNSNANEQVEANEVIDRPPFVDFESGSNLPVLVLRVRADDVEAVRLKS